MYVCIYIYIHIPAEGENVGAEVTSRPMSRPQYDPLMDEIFAISSGEELSREPLVSPKYVPRREDFDGRGTVVECFGMWSEQRETQWDGHRPTVLSHVLGGGCCRELESRWESLWVYFSFTIWAGLFSGDASCRDSCGGPSRREFPGACAEDVASVLEQRLPKWMFGRGPVHGLRIWLRFPGMVCLRGIQMIQLTSINYQRKFRGRNFRVTDF